MCKRRDRGGHGEMIRVERNASNGGKGENVEKLQRSSEEQ